VTLAGALLAACRDRPTDPSSFAPAALSAQFDSVWSRYDATYPYFNYKHVNWDSLRVVYRPQAVAAASEDALATVVSSMLGALRDVHAWLVQPSGITIATYSPAQFINWREDVWLAYLQRYGIQSQPGNWVYGTLGGVPYFAFEGWNPSLLPTAAFDAALEQFRDAPAMIIDVRMNGGGDDNLAFTVAARFFDVTRTVDYVQYRTGPAHSDLGPLQPRTVAPRGAWQFTRPVLLLVGRGCFSSNESFIAAMRELPNVTVAGDTTGGGSGNPITYPLGGSWSYTVPRWIEYTRELQIIEWQGIAPATVIPVTAADWTAGRDPVLDFAIRWAAGG
jgi:hypothetical protein